MPRNRFGLAAQKRLQHRLDAVAELQSARPTMPAAARHGP
jgi:hypothetical protein